MSDCGSSARITLSDLNTGQKQGENPYLDHITSIELSMAPVSKSHCLGAKNKNMIYL